MNETRRFWIQLLLPSIIMAVTFVYTMKIEATISEQTLGHILTRVERLESEYRELEKKTSTNHNDLTRITVIKHNLNQRLDRLDVKLDRLTEKLDKLSKG